MVTSTVPDPGFSDMAFFKFRQSGENPTPSTRPAESVEAMRVRARHRLIGAAVLVLMGVVGFPLLFDTQPRPIPVDIQIDIPDKNKTAPLQMPVAQTPPHAADVPVTSAVPVAPPAISRVVPAKPQAAGDTKVSAAASLDPEEQLVSPEAVKSNAKSPVAKVASKPASKPEPKPIVKPEPRLEVKTENKPEPKPDAKVEAQVDAKADDGARAKSLLEGKDQAKSGAEEHRYVIQVGAFADAAKAQEARMKLERAGLKTYTHVAETKEGPRTRVRVGPFGNRAEAEKVASKVKTLSLPAAILAL